MKIKVGENYGSYVSDGIVQGKTGDVRPRENDASGGHAHLSGSGGALVIAFILGLGLAAKPARAGVERLSGPTALWNQVLMSYVHNARVDYADLQAHPEILNQYIKSLAIKPREKHAQENLDTKIAFLINAYNALTMKTIIDHYPIQWSWAASLIYPKNSIRQIPGVWDRLKFNVMGQEMTLQEIENTLRGLGDPRIHMAIVCASKGCPPLRSEPYLGKKLSAQLDDQTRRFLSNPKKFAIDKKAGVVYLSPIFKWFGGDFAPKFEPGIGFEGQNANVRAALNFISGYLSVDDALYLRGGAYQVEYLAYDWSLNEWKKQ